MEDKVITDKHVLFWGSEFSNFYPSVFTVNNIKFYNNEQYFMYQKAIFFGDNETANEILKYGKNPKEAKKLGRLVANFDNSKWDAVRYDIMLTGLRHKFKSNPRLKELLLSFGDRIFVEASPFDKIWGIGLSQNDINADDEQKWKGQNLLGKALTQLKTEFINENV